MLAMTDTDNFEWVDAMIAEREALNMTQANLAYAAELSRTTISQYELRRSPRPDAKSLAQVSVALKRSPEWLPRLAGILPPEPDTDPTLDQINHLYTTLRYDQSKQQALEYFHFLKTQEERAEYNAKSKSTRKKK